MGRRDIGGRSRVAAPTNGRPGVARSGPPGVSGGGITWPLKGYRPSVPVEDWAAFAELGLAWGNQRVTENWDIVALVRGNDGSLWAAEFAGRGSGYTTGGTEPDWTDPSPITDNDYTWYEVPTTTVGEWQANHTYSEVAFIFAEDHVWVQYPGITGDSGASEPDWATALGADPLNDADYVTDNDIYWWPFPPADLTLIGDPAYGRWSALTLPRHDGIVVESGDAGYVATAVTGDNGVRFDQDGASIFVTSDGTGQRVIVAKGDGFGEGYVPDTTLGYVQLEAGKVVVVDSGGSDNMRLDAITAAAAILQTSGIRLVLKSDPAASSPAASAAVASTIEFYIDEGTNSLKARVVYADGSTVKTGTVALV